MPSSASSIRSLSAWLPTGSCPVPGVEGAVEGEAFWESRMEALLAERGVPSLLIEGSGFLAVLAEAASVCKQRPLSL